MDDRSGTRPTGARKGRRSDWSRRDGITMSMTMARPRATSRRRLRGPSRRLLWGNRPRSSGRQEPRGPVEPGASTIRGETGGSGGGHPPAKLGRRRIERTRRRDLLRRADRRRGGQERGLAGGRVEAGGTRQGRLRTASRRGLSRGLSLLRGAAAAGIPSAAGAATALTGMSGRVERIDARSPGLAHQSPGQHQRDRRPGPVERVGQRVGDRHSHGGCRGLGERVGRGTHMIEADRSVVKGRGGRFRHPSRDLCNPAGPYIGGGLPLFPCPVELLRDGFSGRSSGSTRPAPAVSGSAGGSVSQG
jgi:hypothetical protein